MRLSISVWNRFCLLPASRGRELELVFFISKSISLSLSLSLSPSLPRSEDRMVSLVSATLGLADRVQNWWSNRGFLIPAARWIRQSDSIMSLIFAPLIACQIPCGTCTSLQVVVTSGLHMPEGPCAGTGERWVSFWRNEDMCYGRFMQVQNPVAPRMPPKKTHGEGNIFYVYCSTPGAEPCHEIFFDFFTVVFVKGTLPSMHHQNALESFAAFWQEHVLLTSWGDMLGALPTQQRTGAKLKKIRLVWGFQEETPQRTRTKIWENGLRFILELSNPYLCGKESVFFSQIFLARKSGTGCRTFSATPSRWVRVQLFQGSTTTAMGQLNLQGGDVRPRIVRDAASGST